MNTWLEGTLEDFIILGNGKERPLENGPIPVFGGNGILAYCNKSNYSGKNIVIGRVGAYCGAVIYFDGDIWVSDNALSANVKNNCDIKYIYYFLHNINLNNLAEGSSHPLITHKLIYSLPVKIHPLPEQKAIASVLSSLDDKIDLLQRQNATLEAMAETLFRERFISYSHNDNIVTIDSYILFNPKRSIKRGDMSPYLEMSNLRTDTFCPIEFYDKKFTSGSKFINGDTLLARITPCLENGKKCFVNFLEDGVVAWGSTEYIVMRPINELHPLFAYCLVKIDDFRGYAESCLSGSSGRQRVDVTHLKQYEIKLPTKNDINDFNRFCTAINPKLLNNYKQIKKLENLRDTLLPKLMSGEVRVRVDR